MSLKNYLDLFDISYFNKNNSDRLIWQSHLFLQDSSNSLIIGSRRCFGNLLEVFIKTENFDGLFLKLIEVLEFIWLRKLSMHL